MKKLIMKSCQVKGQTRTDRQHVEIIVKTNTVGQTNHLAQLILAQTKKVTSIKIVEGFNVLAIAENKHIRKWIVKIL